MKAQLHLCICMNRIFRFGRTAIIYLQASSSGAQSEVTLLQQLLLFLRFPTLLFFFDISV
jgi:hypothetical protein